MPGPAARPLVADDDHVAGDDLAGQDGLHRVVLALEDARRTPKSQMPASTPAVFTMQPSLGDIAVEHREAAILGEGVLDVADHAVARSRSSAA